MNKSLFAILLLVSPFVHAQPLTCDAQFELRRDGRGKAQEALDCYRKELGATSDADRNAKSHSYNQASYLEFFMAQFFLSGEAQTRALLRAIDLAERSALLFGPKYSLSHYKKLDAMEVSRLATALYNYGLATARFVDLKGVLEALARMGDIKKSMLTIIRIKQESVAHYGAHRTLGIFHTKVPAIAGGDFAAAKTYLEKALEMTSNPDGLSVDTANHLAYADWLVKNHQVAQSCAQLNLVRNLSPAQVESLNNGLYFETLDDVKKAQILWSQQCP